MSPLCLAEADGNENVFNEWHRSRRRHCRRRFSRGRRCVVATVDVDAIPIVIVASVVVVKLLKAGMFIYKLLLLLVLLSSYQ